MFFKRPVAGERFFGTGSMHLHLHFYIMEESVSLQAVIYCSFDDGYSFLNII